MNEENKEIKFEKAIEKLEQIVEDLEAGNIPLEDALKKYEEGVRLSRLCQQRLTQAEKKIEVLTRSLDGQLKKEPFEFEEEGGAASETKPAKNVKSKSKSAAKDTPAADEEDLLI